MSADARPSLRARYRRVTVRRRALLLAVALFTVAALVVDLMAGPAALSFSEIVAGLLDPEALDMRHRIILWDVRLPDALIAVAVGAALGLAGVESQTVLNNPLASPYTLGLTEAAALGAAVAIVLDTQAIGLPSLAALPILAFLFALGAGLLILALSALAGAGVGTVILFGVALFFLCNALTALLQYVASAEAVAQIVFWTIGDLTKAGWPEVAIVFATVLAMAPFVYRDVWTMTVLRGGEEHAAGAGILVPRFRLFVILRVSVLTAAAVCFVGAIGFVGLVGPHMARMLLGENHRLLVPGAVLCGAGLLSFASFLSKTLVPGAIVPVGIVTALIGVPVFLGLVATRRSVYS